MPRIIVLGAGIGGISMAYELREKVGRHAEILVVSDSEWFHFVPSNPWVALRWRKPEDIKIRLPDLLAKFGIGFDATGARRVLAAEDAIELNDGRKLAYDYLVIATGPALAFDEVPGLGPQANSVSICHVDHAASAAERWERFCEDPGPIVVGAVQGASCFGPAYEFALMINTELRRRKIRDRVPMTFVTSEPYIGHLGLGGVGDTKGLLESLLRDCDIRWLTSTRIDRLDADAVQCTEVAADGKPGQQHSLPAKLSMFIPAFRGVACLMGDDGKGLPGLANPRGFVLVDELQCNPTYRNVFAVGVCIAIPPYEQTPVPVGVPKTGYMIESMVTAVAENIAALVAGKQPTQHPSWNAVCLADFGNSGVAFVALPQIPPRNVNWSGQGYWVHAAKVGFEKYFLHKVRSGASEPGYERLIMKMLGIGKLKSEPGRSSRNAA
ncbi:MAG: NAD(P)/FAD-dependent oxidoreductase [Reyranella sp.]|uniref:NAD(P)/FAD-dependent oxidoreductase n=1 Tax=Reyranella sp. TaxID=1929291 RepID=UPI003D0A1BAF